MDDSTFTQTARLPQFFPHLIFDLSEVLLPGLFGVEKDLSEKLDRSEDEILRAFEAPPYHGHSRRFHRWMTGKLSFDGFRDEVLNTLLLPHSMGPLLQETCRECFSPPYPHTLPLLHSLKKHHRLFLISDHMEPFVKELEEEYDFLHLFERRIWSCQVEATKSEGSPFRFLLEVERLSPEECLFIDDHPPNLHIASGLGMKTYHFTGSNCLDDLEATIKAFQK